MFSCWTRIHVFLLNKKTCPLVPPRRHAFLFDKKTFISQTGSLSLAYSTTGTHALCWQYVPSESHIGVVWGIVKAIDIEKPARTRPRAKPQRCLQTTWPRSNTPYTHTNTHTHTLLTTVWMAIHKIRCAGAWEDLGQSRCRIRTSTFYLIRRQKWASLGLLQLSQGWWPGVSHRRSTNPKILPELFCAGVQGSRTSPMWMKDINVVVDSTADHRTCVQDIRNLFDSLANHMVTSQGNIKTGQEILSGPTRAERWLWHAHALVGTRAWLRKRIHTHTHNALTPEVWIVPFFQVSHSRAASASTNAMHPRGPPWQIEVLTNAKISLYTTLCLPACFLSSAISKTEEYCKQMLTANTLITAACARRTAKKALRHHTAYTPNLISKLLCPQCQHKHTNTHTHTHLHDIHLTQTNLVVKIGRPCHYAWLSSLAAGDANTSQVYAKLYWTLRWHLLETAAVCVVNRIGMHSGTDCMSRIKAA